MSDKIKSKDEIVQELIKVVQERKAEIAKTEKAKWITNCSIPFEGTRINIQTVNDVDTLIRMAGTIIGHKKVLEDGSEFLLGEVQKLELSGFSAEDWLKDIKTRYEKIQLASKKKELEEYESRLDKLVSPEVREQLELEAIQKGLGL